MLSGRRLLVVLDNARDASQVRPLLPGASTCLVLVTSRSQLPGLVATDGAQPITLDLLTPDEARQLLANRLGADRIAAEPQAVDDIIIRCVQLPLALSIVAARAATHPQLPLHTLAVELRDAHNRLNALAGDDPATDMRAVFSWSYHTLTDGAARLFRLLGLHPGHDIGVSTAASLVALPTYRVRPLLAQLARANLLVEHTSGRYALHDLLRLYAIEHAHTTDSDQQRRAAIHRVLDHYLHTAYAAHRLVSPARDPIALVPPIPGVTLDEATEQEQALAWFIAERPNLFAAIEHAAVQGFDIHTWQIACAFTTFLDRRGDLPGWVTVQNAALAAAQRLSDPLAQARIHRLLALVSTRMESFDDAEIHLRRALDLYNQVGHDVGQVRTHAAMGQLCERRGRYADALHHSLTALNLARATGHRAGQAESLNAVGWYHTLLGDFRQAIAYCQQALTMNEVLGNQIGQAAAWDSLGYAEHHLGRHDRAIACYQRAVDLYRRCGDRYYEADTLVHLGDTIAVADNPDGARDAWQRALVILDDLHHPDATQLRAKLASL
jgi:tetratricopeptide (TPR) repeat protein